MSQFDWDYLQENKQNIIKGKLVVLSWNFEDIDSFGEDEDCLPKIQTDVQRIQVLNLFKESFLCQRTADEAVDAMCFAIQEVAGGKDT